MAASILTKSVAGAILAVALFAGVTAAWAQTNCTTRCYYGTCYTSCY